MHLALENKVAIIVGSSSGMGKATARSYAQAGASVVLAARSKDKLDGPISRNRRPCNRLCNRRAGYSAGKPLNSDDTG